MADEAAVMVRKRDIVADGVVPLEHYALFWVRTTCVGGGAGIMRRRPTTFLFVIFRMHSLNLDSHLEITARRAKLIHRFAWG